MQKSLFLIMIICLACTSANFNMQSSPAEEISSPYLHQIQLLAEYSLEYVRHPFAFSPNGELIAINHGKSLSIIRLDNLELISTINPPFGPDFTSPEHDEESIQAMAFLSNETLVTGSSYSPYGGLRLGSLRLWDIPSRQEIAVLEEESAVWNVLASPDGQFISYFRSLEIILMKVDDRSIVYHAVGSNRFIENYMSFTADSRQFAIWSANGVTIINLENLEESFINNDHNDWYNAGYVALALSPDSQTVVLWSYTEMELFDLSSLELISTLNLNNGDFISAIAFEANGSHLIVGRSGGAVDIEVYDYVSGQSVFSMNGHEDTAFSVASHPRYPLFITGSRDGAIKLWDLDAESDSPLFQSMLDWAVYDVAFSPDGRYLIASSDRLLQIWSIE